MKTHDYENKTIYSSGDVFSARYEHTGGVQHDHADDDWLAGGCHGAFPPQTPEP
jgi:hypothetical protein